jgi:hypothetical protein
MWVKISLEHPNKPHCIDTTVTPRASPNGQKRKKQLNPNTVNKIKS